jgi:hypothetical protein
MKATAAAMMVMTASETTVFVTGVLSDGTRIIRQDAAYNEQTCKCYQPTNANS